MELSKNGRFQHPKAVPWSAAQEFERVWLGNRRLTPGPLAQHLPNVLEIPMITGISPEFDQLFLNCNNPIKMVYV